MLTGARPQKGAPMNNEATPNPVTDTAAIPPAPDGGTPDMVRIIGNTIYEVTFHFSTTSRETMDDKILRLIHREMNPS